MTSFRTSNFGIYFRIFWFAILSQDFLSKKTMHRQMIVNFGQPRAAEVGPTLTRRVSDPDLLIIRNRSVSSRSRRNDFQFKDQICFSRIVTPLLRPPPPRYFWRKLECCRRNCYRVHRSIGGGKNPFVFARATFVPLDFGFDIGRGIFTEGINDWKNSRQRKGCCRQQPC